MGLKDLRKRFTSSIEEVNQVRLQERFCDVGVSKIATQGYLVATRHRVLSPQPGVDRYSIPFFLGPRLDAVVEPLTPPPALAAEAIGVSADPDNPLHAEFGENALVGWLRSHPQVARKWWPDVLARRT